MPADASSIDQQTSAPVMRRMSDIQPEQIQWLWPGRIALGKLTVITGDPGVGKSFLTCDIAARVSTGAPWPDDPASRAPIGDVIVMNCEDGLADTIRPRLNAHGANAERIYALESVRCKSADGRDNDRMFDLSRDIAALEAAIDSVPKCVMVSVDPVSAYFGQGRNSDKATDVRGVLEPLARLAERKRVAVVVVSHLNKGNGSAIQRNLGSIAFVAAARAVWCLAFDKENRRRRLFLPVKNNIGNDRDGAAFAITEGVVAWERKPVTTTADEALAVDNNRHGPEAYARKAAAAFLRDILADGPMPTAVVERKAADAGINRSALKRARGELRVKPGRNADGKATIELPAAPEPVEPPARLAPLALLEPLLTTMDQVEQEDQVDQVAQHGQVAAA